MCVCGGRGSAFILLPIPILRGEHQLRQGAELACSFQTTCRSNLRCSQPARPGCGAGLQHAFNNCYHRHRHTDVSVFADPSYAASVSYTDSNVGAILAAAEPVRDSTIVLFVGDHGVELPKRLY